MVTLINIQTLQEFGILLYCINVPSLPSRNITGSIVFRFSLTSLITTGSVETNKMNLKVTRSNGKKNHGEELGEKGKTVILVTL